MRYRKTAPLDEEGLGELIEEGWHELIIYVDGQPYNEEDLFHCCGCELMFPDRWELDDEYLCPDCATEAREEARHMKELRSDYYASQL